jgi:hypothetical protein
MSEDTLGIISAMYQEDISKLRAERQCALDDWAVAQKQIERLTARLADWEDDRAKILNEVCPSDEVHCGCVPVLRAGVERLKGIEKALREMYDTLANAISTDTSLSSSDLADMAKRLTADNARMAEACLLMHACGFAMKKDERGRLYVCRNGVDYYPAALGEVKS